MKRKTQNERVLDYMREFGSITQADAYADLGVTRLASRVHDLRECGERISATYETKRNRWGDAVTYVRYALEES